MFCSYTSRADYCFLFAWYQLFDVTSSLVMDLIKGYIYNFKIYDINVKRIVQVKIIW